MIRIWGRANSINVQKVLWCCAELGVPFERTDAGGAFGVTQDPGYLTMNPTGLVPTIRDGSLTLWESNVIVRYLAARYGADTLCPKDLAHRADADRWMDWQMGTLWAALRPAFIGLVRTPPEERDDAAIRAAVGKTAENWKMLDAHLESRDYVAGPSLTMADIPLGVTAHRWLNLDVERPPTPGVDAWYARLSERSPFREHVMRPLS